MTPSGLGDVKIKLAVTEHGSWIRARDAPLDKRVASKIHNLNKFKKNNNKWLNHSLVTESRDNSSAKHI